VKRHHKTKHSNFSSIYAPKSEVTKRKFTEVRSERKSRQKFMKVVSMESDVMDD